MTASIAAPTTAERAIGFDSEPIYDRHSFLLGTVSLYAPNAPASEWKTLPWRITTSRGWEGHDSKGLEYIVKPETAVEAMNHLGAIGNSAAWAKHYLWQPAL